MLLLCLLAPITSPVTFHLSWLVPLLGLVPSSLAISLFQLKFISLLTAHASLAYLVLPPSEVCLNELWTTITMETTYIQFFLLSLLCASWSLRLRCVEHRDFCCWDLANTWKYLVCRKVIAWSNTGRFLCGKFLLLQMTRELKKILIRDNIKLLAAYIIISLARIVFKYIHGALCITIWILCLLKQCCKEQVIFI